MDSEVLIANRTNYPETYTGPNNIFSQLKIIHNVFGLTTSQSLKFASNLPELPRNAEGWFAIPKVSAVANKFFPEITNSGEQYCKAVKFMLEKLSKSQEFHMYNQEKMTPDHFRPNRHTQNFMENLESQQPGDVLIIPAQFGLLYEGKSIEKAREKFELNENEFGLSTFAVSCMLLTHPNRFTDWQDLSVDAPGDELAPEADRNFSEVFNFCMGDWYLRAESFPINVGKHHGAATGFTYN